MQYNTIHTINAALTELVDHDQRLVGAVPEHHAHVVHLQCEGTLGLAGHVVARRAQEVVVVPARKRGKRGKWEKSGRNTGSLQIVFVEDEDTS